MKSFIALLVLSTLTSMAHADLYDDRANAVAQRSQQNQAAQIIADFNKTQAREVQAITKFGRAHSGYAQQPDCYDFSYRSGGSMFDPSTWHQSSRQVCASGACVTVHGDNDSFDSRPGDAMWADIVARSANIYYCKVVLNNGLACETRLDFDNNTYGGGCLDANGNKRELSVPFKW